MVDASADESLSLREAWVALRLAGTQFIGALFPCLGITTRLHIEGGTSYVAIANVNVVGRTGFPEAIAVGDVLLNRGVPDQGLENGHGREVIKGGEIADVDPQTLVEAYLQNVSPPYDFHESFIQSPMERRSESRNSEEWHSSDWHSSDWHSSDWEDDGDSWRHQNGDSTEYNGWPIEELIKRNPIHDVSEDLQNTSQVSVNAARAVTSQVIGQSSNNDPRHGSCAEPSRIPATDHPPQTQFYAVARGFRVGIDTDREEARQQLIGYAGGKSMVFKTQAKAELYLEKWRLP